jgi:Spy/CpxP family protein refolding chaperone
MLRRSVVLLALSCLGGFALAQTPPSAPPPAAAWHGQGARGAMHWRQKMEQRRMERLTVLLDLTAAQQQQVKAIMSEERARMRPSMQQMMRAMRQLRAAREAARKEAMQKLASALTPLQMKKLELLMPEHPRFMMRGGRGMGMGMRMGMRMGMMGAHPMGPPGPPPPPGPQGP